MKILFVFGFPPRIGGHFKSGLAMIKYLISKGHHVIVMAPDGNKTMIDSYRNIEAEFFGFPEVSYYFPHINVLGAVRVINICRKNNVDIIHAQDFESIPPAYLAAVFLKKGFVFTRPGGPPNSFAPPKHIKSVFFSQELMDEMIERHNLVKKNISLIRARIDTAFFYPTNVDSNFIEKYNLPTSRKTIVMAMRLDKGKRPWINTLLSVANYMKEENKDADIILAGEGTLLEEINDKVTQINRKSQHGKFIYIIGPILEVEEINQLYNYADVVVGHGRGILEAMACKKTVIILGGNCKGEIIDPDTINEAAKYNFSGRHLKDKSSPRELYVMIKNLLSNEEGLRDLGLFSYNYVKTQMDAEIGAQQLLEVYQKSLEKDNTFFDYSIWYITLSRTTAGMILRNRVLNRLHYNKNNIFNI